MLYELLPEGRFCAIPGSKLMVKLGLSDTRQIRKIAERERAEGKLICSCQYGYYKPVTEGELLQYIKTIEAHIKGCKMALKPAYKALKIYYNQMKIGEYDG